MQTILILGAGKSSTVLIRSLLEDAFQEDWNILVADSSLLSAEQKIAGHPRGWAHFFSLEQTNTWHPLVEAADLVISMLPPSCHITIANACLRKGRHFLNASYLSPEIKNLHQEVCEKGLLFLSEMGLDPGIDHMSAMEAINHIQQEGGQIEKFYSHCGGLIAPESDDNPWHYKISWNPRNVVLAGKDGARFLEKGKEIYLPYYDLFDARRTIDIPNAGIYAWYPNRDSIPYVDIYGLTYIQDFVRTTLRHPDFCKGWNALVRSGCTDDTQLIDTDLLYFDEFFRLKLAAFSNVESGLDAQFEFLGLFQHKPIQMGRVPCADILQKQLESTLPLNPEDHDMILLVHEIEYRLNNNLCKRKMSLVVKGEDDLHTAMAKTVGLPLAIAAKLLLNGSLKITGVHIPIHPEIYMPVLKMLEKKSIRFTVDE